MNVAELILCGENVKGWWEAYHTFFDRSVSRDVYIAIKKKKRLVID